MWWLIRRGLLLSLKQRPLRIELPLRMTAEEAEAVRDEWKRLHGGSKR
jgi:hypothetical protein